MPSVHLLMLTWNRLEYTKLALAALLADPDESFQLTIWDNASRSDTRHYLSHQSDPRISDVVFSPENVGQSQPFNAVFRASNADLIGKVDNDCVVTPGWTRVLSDAHDDVAEFGAIGSWQFQASDFDEVRARRKIIKYGNHRVLRHPWIGGSGLLIKREAFVAHGPCPNVVSYFASKIASAGYVNGWYYPLILQDHLDDPMNTPRSAGEEGVPLHQVAGSVENRNAVRWRKEILRNIHDDPFDPAYYSSFRARVLRRMRSRMRK